jgi:short-subunit dehydrogenase
MRVARSLIVGASAGLGRALAEHLAVAGHDLFLIASDERDLAAMRDDLRIRHAAKVAILAMDLAAPEPACLRTEVLAQLGGIDNLFYVAGVSRMDADALADDVLNRLVAVNFTSGLRIINAFLADLSKNADANIVGMGSVAAARGRRMNSVYCAAKRGFEAYFEALRHRLAGLPCRVQFYRLGYLRTRMTFGQKLLLPALDPAVAAQVIAANLGKDTGLVYLPWWWRPVSAIIVRLPWPIFKRLNI